VENQHVKLFLPRDIRLHFDGACTPKNPGGTATYGWTMEDREGFIATGHGVVERNSTNNVAEWGSLLSALGWLKSQNWKGTLHIMGDSQLVVHQIKKKWGVKAPHLKPYRDECLELLKTMCGRNWTAGWVPRDRNADADRLSKKAYKIDVYGDS
jgi:ribonuclease HI